MHEPWGKAQGSYSYPKRQCCVRAGYRAWVQGVYVVLRVLQFTHVEVGSRQIDFVTLCVTKGRK